ncbi:MAG: IPT/TIG domain-containing protein [Terriglobales bacterium]
MSQQATVITITSISPASVYMDSPSFTLTVNGTGFAAGDIVCFYDDYYGTCDGLVTSYVSPTELTAQVPASFLTTATSQVIYVIDGSGDLSNYVLFSVVGFLPSISSLSPPSIGEGTAPSPITVNGGVPSFMNGATVQWNGKTLPTIYISPTQVQFTPTKAELEKASMVQITVTNPAPGGLSTAYTFDITYNATVKTLDLPANQIIYDPYAQLIYASLPSSYGPNGNSIAVIKPQTGKVVGYHYVGSEPHQLALSTDSQYLYVGLDGSGSVQRFILPNFTPDIEVSLGAGYDGGMNVATSLQVSPSSDHTWAVAQNSSSCCYDYGVYFYTDATQLPDNVTYNAGSQILFVNASTLYSYSQDYLTPITVNSKGGTAGTTWSDLVQGSSIAYADGLIYGNAGQAFNPATGLLLGSFDISTGSGCCTYYNLLLPIAPFNRMLVAGATPFLSSFGITSYNLDEFTPQAAVGFEQFAGDQVSNFISWGNDGVAFVTESSTTPLQTAIVTSPHLVAPASTTKNPLPAPASLSPASTTHGGWNFILTINGSGFAPDSTVTWNKTMLTTAFVSSSQLNAYVPYTDIASAGTASIVVSNPAPGGGKATALNFTIN